MKKSKNIYNLDSLQREIYRLKLEAKRMEEKFDSNIEDLQENYASMAMNSIFHKCRHKENGKSNFFDSFFENYGFHAMNKIGDRIVEKAAEGIEGLIGKLFHKKK